MTYLIKNSVFILLKFRKIVSWRGWSAESFDLAKLAPIAGQQTKILF